MKFLQKNILAVAVVIILVLGGGVFYLNQQKASDKSSDVSQTQVATSTVLVKVKADGNENSFEVEDAVGKTALEVTEAATTVEKSGEGENAFVTAINGRVANSNKNEFWKLVINGEDAQVGAGSYTVESGDTIAWEIDTF